MSTSKALSTQRSAWGKLNLNPENKALVTLPDGPLTEGWLTNVDFGPLGATDDINVGSETPLDPHLVLAKASLEGKVSYETIYNDRADTMQVWWQCKGGSCPVGGYNLTRLKPYTSTHPKKWLVDDLHEVCVRDWDGRFMPDHMWKQHCRSIWSPPNPGQFLEINVTYMFPVEKLFRLTYADYKDDEERIKKGGNKNYPGRNRAMNKLRMKNNARAKKGKRRKVPNYRTLSGTGMTAGFKMYAVEPPAFDVFPGIFVLAFFMLVFKVVLSGLQKFRSAYQAALGLHETLMH